MQQQQQQQQPPWPQQQMLHHPPIADNYGPLVNSPLVDAAATIPSTSSSSSSGGLHPKPVSSLIAKAAASNDAARYQKRPAIKMIDINEAQARMADGKKRKTEKTTAITATISTTTTTTSTANATATAATTVATAATSSSTSSTSAAAAAPVVSSSNSISERSASVASASSTPFFDFIHLVEFPSYAPRPKCLARIVAAANVFIQHSLCRNIVEQICTGVAARIDSVRKEPDAAAETRRQRINDAAAVYPALIAERKVQASLIVDVAGAGDLSIPYDSSLTHSTLQQWNKQTSTVFSISRHSSDANKPNMYLSPGWMLTMCELEELKSESIGAEFELSQHEVLLFFTLLREWMHCIRPFLFASLQGDTVSSETVSTENLRPASCSTALSAASSLNGEKTNAADSEIDIGFWFESLLIGGHLIFSQSKENEGTWDFHRLVLTRRMSGYLCREKGVQFFSSPGAFLPLQYVKVEQAQQSPWQDAINDFIGSTRTIITSENSSVEQVSHEWMEERNQRLNQMKQQNKSIFSCDDRMKRILDAMDANLSITSPAPPPPSAVSPLFFSGRLFYYPFPKPEPVFLALHTHLTQAEILPGYYRDSPKEIEEKKQQKNIHTTKRQRRQQAKSSKRRQTKKK